MILISIFTSIRPNILGNRRDLTEPTKNLTGQGGETIGVVLYAVT